jgi:hypothetical protein
MYVSNELPVLGPATAPSDPCTAARRRRLAFRATCASLFTWTAAFVLSLTWLKTRPPCPPNYVRLIDFGAAVPAFAVLALLVSAGALLLTRSVGLHRTVAVIMCVSTALALLVAASTADQLLSDKGAQYASGCWTF